MKLTALSLALAASVAASAAPLTLAELLGRRIVAGEVDSISPSYGRGVGGLVVNHTVIAASNSPEGAKAVADVVCTGTNDELVISAAIKGMTRGGTVQLLDGDFYVDSFKNEGNSAIYFGYNDGQARVVNIVGTTENKGYNTQFGAVIHVRQSAIDAMDPKASYRVFYGAGKKPEKVNPADYFYVLTHVNNANFEHFQLRLGDASKRIRGIDGGHFGSMEVKWVGIYTEEYFNDRFFHRKPKTPAIGSVGITSVPSSNDEMARIGYEGVNVGGLWIGFHQNRVDHLVMRVCTAARNVYGYVFDGGLKTLTMINCCDEGNVCLPLFRGKGNITAIDFNIERFNEAYIIDTPKTVASHYAYEEKPGSWNGEITYTLQGSAFKLRGFWEKDHGKHFRTVRFTRR